MRCAKFSKLSFAEKLRICSCLACVYQVMDARGKFGEHEKCVRVARGAATLAFLLAGQKHATFYTLV